MSRIRLIDKDNLLDEYVISIRGHDLARLLQAIYTPDGYADLTEYRNLANDIESIIDSDKYEV